MKLITFIISIAVLLGACASSASLGQGVIDDPEPLKAPTDSLTITIDALDLSEDLSKILSTKNDELLIFIYEHKADGSLEAPLLQHTMVLDLEHKKKSFTWKKDSSLLAKELLFIMIEQDYDTPIEQLDPIIRIQHKHITKAFKKRDYKTLRTYLGTEDLLGYKRLPDFSFDEPVSFAISGVYKLDLYKYNITIGPD